jgi:hypothetical protein
MALLNSDSMRQALTCDRLPLAVYRELAAHLNLVVGVQAVLLPQTSQEFDYLQSQVGGVAIELDPVLGDRARQQVEAILNHYADRFGPWRSLPMA